MSPHEEDHQKCRSAGLDVSPRSHGLLSAEIENDSPGSVILSPFAAELLPTQPGQGSRFPVSKSPMPAGAVIKALLTPATRHDPDEGDRNSEIVGAATNVLPFDNTKSVGLKVAAKLADAKSCVLANSRNGSGLPLESCNGPEPMSPREMTRGGPPLGSAVSVAFIQVKAVEAGKSGGRSNCP